MILLGQASHVHFTTGLSKCGCLAQESKHKHAQYMAAAPARGVGRPAAVGGRHHFWYQGRRENWARASAKKVVFWVPFQGPEYGPKIAHSR